ncbi:MAG TPA: FAD-binding protein [Candidatus Thermoplasmatota archaeon]|nr:FAD-binding protein [Candidatus Thermoplasmatota archaeon]
MTHEVLNVQNKKLDDAVMTARLATHCGMCKVDFLGTGLCPSGMEHGFAAYWPEGKMEILKALHDGRLRPTETLVEIAESCTSCGICDRQCHFITHLRPQKVCDAIKEYVNHCDEKDIQSIPEDDTLRDLRSLVGEQWASNDPAIIVAYAKTVITENAGSNFYVIMPETTEEIAAVMSYASTRNIPCMPRGNGTLLSLFADTLLAKAISLEKGIILDLRRMKKLQIDAKNQTATVGAGISSYELQEAAHKHGLRALVAEASAHVCPNITTFGIISPWGNNWGGGPENYIDLTLVDPKGVITHVSDQGVANPFTTNNRFTNLTLTPSKIITEATVKLHPIFKDEEALFVPFEHLGDALDFALLLATRKIGLSLTLMSSKYLSEFICPTNEIAEDFDSILKNDLKLHYLVDVICDSYSKKIVEQLADVVIDQPMLKTLMLSSPALASLKDSELLNALSKEENPLKAVFAGPLRKHLEKGLDPSPKQMAQKFDKDLQGFFEKMYAKPEMTDVVWLHDFRILPSRLMRQKMFLLRGGYLVADKQNILTLTSMLDEVALKYHLEHALGFIVFINQGRFAFLEYDYYFDHLDPDARNRLNQSVIETLQRELRMKDLLPVEYVVHKGMFRKEQLLYPMPQGLSDEELKVLGGMIRTVVGA